MNIGVNRFQPTPAFRSHSAVHHHHEHDNGQEPINSSEPSIPSDKLDPPVNKERLLNDFLELVQVPGASRKERKIADKIKEELAEMGLEAFEDDAGKAIRGNAGNLIVNIEGNVEGAPTLLFAAHMDTVPLAVGVKPQIKDGYVITDGTTALGGDNRAGVAEILEAVREVREQNLPHGDLQLLFTVAEEEGLLGAQALDPKLLKSDYAFAVDVFEANQLYTQGRHFLINGEEPPKIDLTKITHDDIHAAREAAKHAPVVPPSHLRLTEAEKKIFGLATDAMQDLGFKPEFRAIEWAGTDAIALREHGLNAISLGAGEDNPHTRSERVEITDLERSTQLIRSLIANAAEMGTPKQV
jgi:di/tripeptidase